MKRIIAVFMLSLSVFSSVTAAETNRKPYRFDTYYLDTPLNSTRAIDIFMPEKCTQNTAIFFVHGGGWRAGSRTKFHSIMQEFGKRGYITASAGYRLGAPSAFEQVQDLREAYDLFVTFLKEHNRPLKIAVYGESAGAHLGSLLVCADPGEIGEVCQLVNPWIKPCKGIFQATPMDFLHWEGMMPQFWNQMQNIAGAPYDKDPQRYERLSLKNYIRKDNPPIFFMEAELEHLFLSRHTLKAVKQHRQWGIASHWKVYEFMEHGFFHELRRKQQFEALEDICRFLDDKLTTV